MQRVTLRRMRVFLLVLLGVTVLAELTLIGGLAALLIWLQAPATIVAGATMIAATVAACVLVGMRSRGHEPAVAS
jgi:hypothetical protein